MLTEMTEDVQIDEFSPSGARKKIKRVVRQGKVVRKKINVGRKKRLTAKQKSGLRKARRKAQTSMAKRKRAKSSLIRKRRIQ